MTREQQHDNKIWNEILDRHADALTFSMPDATCPVCGGKMHVEQTGPVNMMVCNDYNCSFEMQVMAERRAVNDL